MEVKFKSRLQRRKLVAVSILNRSVTVVKEGLENEADQRHAEILMKGMEIDEGSGGFTTPGNSSEGGHGVGGEVKGERNESKYRAVAARGN